jgi:hypothetical protein
MTLLLVAIARMFSASPPRYVAPPLVACAWQVRSLDGRLAFRDISALGFALGAHRREYWH